MSTALEKTPGWYIEFLAAVIRQAPRPGEIDQKTAEEWTSNQKGLKKNLAICLLPQTSVVSAEPAKPELLLDLVGTVTIPATTSKFVAKDKFVINTVSKDKVKIVQLGINFTNRFLSGDGKTEDLIDEQTLHYYKLRKASFDAPIITELGGAEKSETTLSEMFSLMENQKNGEDNVLLNNGRSNIFYVKDQKGVLLAVLALWIKGGWSVEAYSTNDLYRWLHDSRVFSRNPTPASSRPLAPAQA